MKTITSVDHHIQRAIICQLSLAKEKRFSELKPNDMESNVFDYHLKQLLAARMIRKTESGAYELDMLGLTFIDGLSSENKLQRKQPKVICILALQNETGDWLLAKRLQQPYIGTWMFPSGKQHFGESFEEHAPRELAEKLGLKALPLEHRGFVDIRIAQADTLITHAVGHVFYARISEKLLTIPDDDRFEYSWHSLSEDVVVTLMAGTKELHDLLIHNNSFVSSINCSL